MFLKVKEQKCAFCEVFTYKPGAVVTESGFHVSGLLEVVHEAKAKFRADDTSPHKVSSDLLSAHHAFPEKSQKTHCNQAEGSGLSDLHVYHFI